MTEIEKLNGCMALLIELCMRKTNANKVTIRTDGTRYKGELLGDYKLVITRTAPKEEVEDV